MTGEANREKVQDMWQFLKRRMLKEQLQHFQQQGKKKAASWKDC